MVVIPLKAQFVSLISTFVLAVSELLAHQFLTAATSLSESRRLAKGQRVRIRTHVKHARLITLFSVLTFIALEIIVSNFSDPVRTPLLEQQRCVIVDAFNRQNGSQDLHPRVDAMESQCTLVDEHSFVQLAANVSIESNAISCSDQPIFRLNFRWLAEPELLPAAGATLVCERQSCLLAVKQGNLTYFSGVFPSELRQQATDAAFGTQFTATELFFDTAPFLRQIATRFLRAASHPERGLSPISDPYELRRRAFSGSSFARCEFELLAKDETLISTAVLALVLVVVALSVLCYLACFGFSKKRFSNLSDPMQWASRTFRAGEHQKESIKNPVVTSANGEQGFMFIVSQDSDSAV
eukprot:TRINITY_DN502_c0_g1_i1.p3 TRINITY_DN502_c0_g1~~TRINITY_DN502_c0_g1_i1.p3  ORF type:complete len:354 (+),score=73.86 TRINITY_DN502_c0_g1_i1:8505-9566(+)